MVVGWAQDSWKPQGETRSAGLYLADTHTHVYMYKHTHRNVFWGEEAVVGKTPVHPPQGSEELAYTFHSARRPQGQY